MACADVIGSDFGDYRVSPNTGGAAGALSGSGGESGGGITGSGGVTGGGGVPGSGGTGSGGFLGGNGGFFGGNGGFIGGNGGFIGGNGGFVGGNGGFVGGNGGFVGGNGGFVGNGGVLGAGGAVVNATCPTNLRGPRMVVAVSPTSVPYCIDSTEITNAQYAQFVAAGVTPTSTFGCSDSSYTPKSGWPASSGFEAYPVVFVDWCMAYAYCEWAGKHLCGKIGGGANAYADYANALNSEWFNACSKGNTLKFPYGDTFVASACNVAGISTSTRAVGPTLCEGGYSGLYDMSGNVAEWENSCSGNTSSDSCRLRGGTFDRGGAADGYASARCDDSYSFQRGAAFNDVGFRCCAQSL